MKIDAHMHVNFKGKSHRGIIQYLDRNRFDSCWLMSWEEMAPHPDPKLYRHLSIEAIYEAYTQYPDRIIPMYAPDPHREDASERLVYWHGKGIRGCAELKATLNWHTENVRKLLCTASNLGIPVVFHMEESIKILVALKSDSELGAFLVRLFRSNRLFGSPRILFNILKVCTPFLKRWEANRTFLTPGYMLDFTSLAKALRDFTDLRFVGHGPLFWKNISSPTVPDEPIYPKGPIKEEGLTCQFLRDYNNLYADISGYSGFNALNRDHDFARKFLSGFSHKILFGTDNENIGLEKLVESFNLSSEAKRKIYGENAIAMINKCS